MRSFICLVAFVLAIILLVFLLSSMHVCCPVCKSDNTMLFGRAEIWMCKDCNNIFFIWNRADPPPPPKGAPGPE